MILLLTEPTEHYYIHLAAYKFLICGWYFVFLDLHVVSFWNPLSHLVLPLLCLVAQSVSLHSLPCFAKLNYGVQVWNSVFSFQELNC